MEIKFEQLIESIEECGYEAQSYSGRGMYGEHCVGIVCSDPENLLVMLTLSLVRGYLLDFEDDQNKILFDKIENHLDDVYEFLRSPRMDSMGKQSIIYWPHIKWEEENSEE